VKSNIPLAQERHVARQSTFERGLALGLAQHTRPSAPSPLREGRGDSPDPVLEHADEPGEETWTVGKEIGLPVAERYTFEVLGAIDDIDMELVLERLATGEIQEGELYL